jgi:tetratricopeptide (TPR) repeat protein
MDSQKDAEAWFQKGYKQITRLRGEDLSEFKSDNKDALAAFDKATSLKPDHAEAWFWKGSALSVLGRHEEALAAYEEVLRLEPSNYSAREHKAEVLGKLGRLAEAAFERGLRWAILSLTADHVSDLRSELGESLAAFAEAVSLKPDYADAWFWKGEVLAQLNRYEQAVAAYDAALRCQPEDPDTWRHKADALRWLGKHDEALAAYEEVLRLRPDDSAALSGKTELAALARHE